MPLHQGKRGTFVPGLLEIPSDRIALTTLPWLTSFLDG